jgi:hypothetical protein
METIKVVTYRDGRKTIETYLDTGGAGANYIKADQPGQAKTTLQNPRTASST